MIVHVRGYLTYRDLVGRRQVEIEDGATLGMLLERLGRDLGDSFTSQVFDRQAGLHRAVGVIVNGVSATRSQNSLELGLQDGDEIAVFPPMAGG